MFQEGNRVIADIHKELGVKPREAPARAMPCASGSGLDRVPVSRSAWRTSDRASATVGLSVIPTGSRHDMFGAAERSKRRIGSADDCRIVESPMPFRCRRGKAETRKR
jgi:hypothetical protein